MRRLAVAAAALVVLLAGCTMGSGGMESSPSKSSATAAPSPTPSAEHSPTAPPPSAPAKPTAGDAVTLSCAGAVEVVIGRTEPVDFTPAWNRGATNCYVSELVIPRNGVEIAAHAAAEYPGESVSTLYGMCGRTNTDDVYLDPSYTLSLPQVAEVRGVLTLCPSHPNAPGWAAAIERSGGDTSDIAPVLDLTTDEGLCAADAELTNLELNDALAPLLGFPADRDARTSAQDESIREHKNAAFLRACPQRAS